MVFYRKYRPQTIDELDSTQVREKLNAVLSSKDIPHAFLFTGPKGLGKTSTARIVAKAVNCQGKGERGKGKEEKKLHPSPFTLNPFDVPCNVCDACISITNGTNIDVLEIDGASNRGIDEIRDLREKVRLAPSTLKKKVYIIDEVHMLTTEAFNALLKTIEEPPNHVMFIFCTTESQKVPATIVSRCFHVAFQRATDEELKRSMERIVLGENLQVDNEALQLIANLADGGFRDAAKILEEISLLAKEKKITKDFIEKKYHVTNSEQNVHYLLEFLTKKDTKSALQLVQTLVEQGVDLRYFITRLLDYLHKILLMKTGIHQEDLKFEIGNLKLEISEITELVSIFSNTYGDMKYAVIPQLPLEIAVIKWCTMQGSICIENTEVSSIPSNSQIPSNPSASQPSLNTLRKQQQALKVQNILNPVKSEPKKMQDDAHEQRSIPASAKQNETLLENMIYKTKPYNHSVAAVLRGCKIKLFDSNVLVLETAYKFHKERLDEKKTRQILEKVIKEITGKEVEIKVELKSART